MTNKNILKNIESRCAELRLSVAELCKIARVAYSTIWRWRKNSKLMTMSVVRKLEAALDAREKKKEGKL